MRGWLWVASQWIAMLWLLALPAQAEQSSPVVRIKQFLCTGTSCSDLIWSGAMIGGMPGQQVAVLTCAHGYDPRRPVSIKVTFASRQSEWIDARFLAIERDIDLGLLAFTHAEPLAVFRIAAAGAEPGDSLTSEGFPAGTYASKSLRVVRHHTLVNGAFQTEVMPAFEQGDSGGPVLKSGEIVGVAVSADVIRPGIWPGQWENLAKKAEGQPYRNAPPAGHYVAHQTLCQFIERHRSLLSGSGPGGPPGPRPAPVDVMEPDPAANLGAPEPIFRRKPAPTPVPASAPAAKAEPVAAAPDTPAAPEVDWSLAHAVIVVKRQAAADTWGWLLGPLEQLTAQEVGPGAAIRRYLHESTGSKIAVTIVYERIAPKRYEAVLAASGMKPPDVAGVVLIIRSQDAGLVGGLVRKVALGWVERAAARGLKDLPVELVFERSEQQTIADLETALDVVDDQASGSWLEVILAALLPLTWGGDQLTKNYRPRRASRPAAWAGAGRHA